MKTQLIGIFGVFLALCSCSNQVVANFEIKNNTELRIDSLKVEPNVNKKGKYISLEPLEIALYRTHMTATAKADGAYRISFISDNKKRSQIFGYYTNGGPIEKMTRIGIEKDTIKFDFEFGY